MQHVLFDTSLQNIIFITKVAFGSEESTGCDRTVLFSVVFSWRAQRKSHPRRGIFLIYAGQSRTRNYEVRARPQLPASSSVSSSLVPSSSSVRVRARPPLRARHSNSVDLLRPAPAMEARWLAPLSCKAQVPCRQCCLRASLCCAALHH